MPRIVREGVSLPDWCQLKQFSIISLEQAGVQLTPHWRKERIVSCAGSVNVIFGDRSQVVGNGQFIDFSNADGPITVKPVSGSGKIVHLCGEWSAELGGCGMFSASDTASPSDKGDPVPYPKTTSIDSHYHDCDEYWILLEGRATVVVDGEAADFRPGDCLCIGMGHHHDMPHAPEQVKAVFFETSLQREKRVGHLWEHTHGTAVPAEGRI